MKLEVEINKKYFIVIMTTILVLAGAFLAVSYGTSNPAVFGHSLGEISPINTLSGDSITINARNITFISPDGAEFKWYEKTTTDGADFYSGWFQAAAGSSGILDTCNGDYINQYSCPANAYKDCVDTVPLALRFVSCKNESQRTEYVVVNTPKFL